MLQYLIEISIFLQMCSNRDYYKSTDPLKNILLIQEHKLSLWLRCYRIFADPSWYDQYNISRLPAAVIHSLDYFRAKPTKSMTCSRPVQYICRCPAVLICHLNIHFQASRVQCITLQSWAPFCWHRQP